MLKHDINIPLLATIGIVASMLLLVVLFGVQAWYDWEVDNYFADTWGNSISQKVAEQKAAQKGDIESAPRFVDPSKRDVARIPIAQAMDEIVKNGGTLPK